MGETRLAANVRHVQTITETIKARGLFVGDALEVAKTTLVGLLEATTVVRGLDRDESGRPLYAERPDNAIRLAAAVKIIELETGKAPQTLDIQHHGQGEDAQKPEDAIAMLKQNPDLLRSMFRSYVEAVKHAQNPIFQDVNATTVDSKSENESPTRQR